MNVTVLGGAGAMSQVIDRDLTASPGVSHVVVADLSRDRAEAVVKAIGSDKLEAAAVDVTDNAALRRGIDGADVVINATWYEFNRTVMAACIAAGVHYVDLGGLYRMTRKQLELDGEAKDAGITCLLGMGSTPGTMNVMAAHSASQCDAIDAIHLRSASKTLKPVSFEGFVPPYSIRTILDEFTLPVPVVRDGRLQEIPSLTRVTFSMPDPLGQMDGLYTIHSELATIPETVGKGARTIDFAVAFEPEFTEVLVTLARLGLASREGIPFRGQEIVPYEFVAAAIDRLPKPEEEELDVDIQRCEVIGTKDGRQTRIVLDAIAWPREDWNIAGGTVGTGTPPSVAAQWIGDGRIGVRGAVPPEVCVDPLPFFRELHAAGRTIEVYEQVDGGDRRPLFR